MGFFADTRSRRLAKKIIEGKSKKTYQLARKLQDIPSIVGINMLCEIAEKGTIKHVLSLSSEQKKALEALSALDQLPKSMIPRIAKLLRIPACTMLAAKALQGKSGVPTDVGTKTFMLLAFGSSMEKKSQEIEEVIGLGQEDVLPVIEQFLLGCPAKYWYAFSRGELFLNAMTVFSDLHGVPRYELRDLFVTISDFYGTNVKSASSFTDRGRDIVEEILKEFPPSSDDEIVKQIRNGRKSRVEAIRECRITGLKTTEVIAALALAVQDYADADGQMEAIYYLGELGPEAKVALPALRQVVTCAGRPVTKEDFSAQEQILGGLKSDAWEQIQKGMPIDRELMRVAKEAITAIEVK